MLVHSMRYAFYNEKAVPDHIDFLQITRECDVPVPLTQCPDQSIAIYLLYQMSLYSLSSEWRCLPFCRDNDQRVKSLEIIVLKVRG